ncbi:Ubiquitin carboxyl-terminal hydrolase 15 [Leucoagaricus sp. SymC.cos]|nr:Ubiquitin carboxyl-terminal hydrolase 15 [Leucoagaricus sp. SymC.cos]
MYANSHQFMDFNTGIRVESNESVTILHSGLQTVRNLGKALFSEPSPCHACGGPAKSRCSKCIIKYCSKKCQVADWKLRHKQECITAQNMARWRNFDWSSFDHYRPL